MAPDTPVTEGPCLSLGQTHGHLDTSMTRHSAALRRAIATKTAAPLHPFSVDMRTATKALVLQGGGALGAYQAGIYEVIAERSGHVDWVAGVSIGAINAALIAGNAPAQRVARLREFWHLVSSGPGQRLPDWAGERAVLNQWSATMAMATGIPGFFGPRWSPALLMGGAAPLLSYYDATRLKATLERLVDLDRINSREMRFSVGAVNPRGNPTSCSRRRWMASSPPPTMWCASRRCSRPFPPTR